MGEMETRLDRLKAEKKRTEEKIRELKNRLKGIKEAIVAEENLAIIGTVRSSHISLDELADLLKPNDNEGNNNDTKTE
ncbi:MAG: DUF4315 family protein [Clostridia bacterium]|nr:DUF4315 family protein [Clostridia bacterium]